MAANNLQAQLSQHRLQKSITIEEYDASCHGPDEYWHNQTVGHYDEELFKDTTPFYNSKWTKNSDESSDVENYCTYSFSGVTAGRWDVQAFIPSDCATTNHACYEIAIDGTVYGAEINQGIISNN
ncbi:MAG: hypothetical protein SD837_10885 [Candidatus Electrothrix scaldis]|nr:MAG: hypothetical protein SD837_10885 [Candidatus Electrothrix sp. GW3-3]